MISQRQDLERILAEWLIVLAHIDKYTLFVRQLLVLLEFVVEPERKDNFFDLSLWVRRFTRLILLVSTLTLNLCIHHFLFIITILLLLLLLFLQLLAPLDLVFLSIVDIGQEVDVFLLFPWRPDEVTIGPKALFTAILPPVSLLQHWFDDRVVVARADIELLGHIDFRILFPCGSWCRVFTAHVKLNDVLRELVSVQDRLMQQTLHLDLQVKDEFAAVEELSQWLLWVKLFRYLNVDLLGYLLQFNNASILNQAVAWGPR